jgi:hypothetical protein
MIEEDDCTLNRSIITVQFESSHAISIADTGALRVSCSSVATIAIATVVIIIAAKLIGDFGTAVPRRHCVVKVLLVHVEPFFRSPIETEAFVVTRVVIVLVKPAAVISWVSQVGLGYAGGIT